MPGSNYWTRNAQRSLGRRAILRGGAIAGAGAASMALLSCGDDDGPSADNTAAAGSGSPSPQATSTSAAQADLTATLRVGIAADTGNYDPHTLGGVGNAPNLVAHFNSPMIADPVSGQIVGLLADGAWLDNKTFQLKVKPGIKFHNGEVFDAEALRFNLDRGLGKGTDPLPAPTQKNLVSGVQEVTVLDASTVNVNFTRADLSFANTLAKTWAMIPPAQAKRVGNQGVAAEPIGTGAFKFVSRTRDTELRSARNDAFFNSRDAKYGPRLPYVANLVQFIRPELQGRLAALEAGEIDFAVEVSPDLARSFESKAGFNVFHISDGRPLHIHFNTLLEKDPATGGANPWRDLRVRKAANLAVDLDTITKKLLTGKERPSFAVSSDSVGYPPDLIQKRFKYDVKQAKELLRAAGFENGFETDYHAPSDAPSIPGAAEVAPAVVGYLAEVGIKANLKLLPQAQFLQYQTNLQNPGMFHLAGLAGDANTVLFSQILKTGVITHSYDAALGLDVLIEKQAGEFDPAKRAVIISEITTKFYENASWLFLYEAAKVHVGRKNIEWTPWFRAGSFPELWNIKVLKS